MAGSKIRRAGVAKARAVRKSKATPESEAKRKQGLKLGPARSRQNRIADGILREEKVSKRMEHHQGKGRTSVYSPAVVDPKVLTHRALAENCREIVPEIITALRDIACNAHVHQDYRAAVRASQEILDRAYGRPVESIRIAGASPGNSPAERILSELEDVKERYINVTPEKSEEAEKPKDEQPSKNGIKARGKAKSNGKG